MLVVGSRRDLRERITKDTKDSEGHEGFYCLFFNHRDH